MNIFAGFGSLGYVCLKEILSNGIKIDLVLSHKDGSEHSVDGFSIINNIDYYYSDLREDKLLLKEISEKEINYLISVNYRFILPKDLLIKSKHRLNLHGSLLPKYRGRTPHVWAIINGETKTGVTCHVMEESVDTGEIYHQIEVEILDDDTGFDVVKKFEKLYPICLNETLKKIQHGFLPVSQLNDSATYYGKRSPEMGYIDFTKDKKSLINFIRAQAKPYPGAYCFMPDGKKLIVHRAEEFTSENLLSFSLGSIHKKDEKFYTKVKDGYLLFTDFEIV